MRMNLASFFTSSTRSGGCIPVFLSVARIQRHLHLQVRDQQVADHPQLAEDLLILRCSSSLRLLNGLPLSGST